MEVKEIIRECLNILGVDDFTNKVTLSVEEENIKNRFMSHLNLVYKEIASEYLPFVKKETLRANNGFDVSDLSENAIRVKKIKSGGIDIPFEVERGRVELNFLGEVEVEYSYMPLDLDYLGYIDDIRLRITHLAYGILSQHYFENGMYDLAKYYDDKFSKGIKTVKYSKGIILPRRSDL